MFDPLVVHWLDVPPPTCDHAVLQSPAMQSPEPLTLPATSSLCDGVEVPMPTLPLLRTASPMVAPAFDATVSARSLALAVWVWMYTPLLAVGLDWTNLAALPLAA